MLKKTFLCLPVILYLSQLSYGQTLEKAPCPTKEWSRMTLAEQKLNPEPINKLVNLIREGNSYPDIHSLLMVRNGFLILEEYFGEYNSEKIHTLQSVSKSFTSALIGIAIEKGFIKDVNEKILSFFPDMKDIENMDERKKAIILKDLLTMRSGTDYNESYNGSPHHQLNRLSKGWDRFYLNRPMVSKPGSRFQYDSGGVILMSAILNKRAGMHADKFAEKHLFPYLGIKRTHWIKNSEEHPHTGGGLFLLPQDMAKFGLLYLRGGKWEDKQVVPEQWVAESFKMHHDFGGSRQYDIGYGYLWWILKPDPEGGGQKNIYAAKGFMGQYIFVIPEYDMVVVVTGGAKNGRDMRRPVAFLYSHILPSIKK
ncbi:serine hydrolase domain-containing protein [candidate division KSB1 bacterium]